MRQVYAIVRDQDIVCVGRDVGVSAARTVVDAVVGAQFVGTGVVFIAGIGVSEVGTDGCLLVRRRGEDVGESAAGRWPGAFGVVDCFAGEDFGAADGCDIWTTGGELWIKDRLVGA